MYSNKVDICGINTSKLKVLTSAEKERLLIEMRNGDGEARGKLIDGNLKLVLSVIQRFSNRGENLDDLFQVGCIGLIKAVDNFDITIGVKFSTYAVPPNVAYRKLERASEMTRKQALCEILGMLESSENKELAKKISEIIDDMPFTGWSERTIFDTIDQFIIDNNRIPTGTDFKKKGLPPHPVIKLRFGINLKEFLNKYYPVKKLCDSKDYYHKTKEEWQEIFLNEYKTHKPHSGEEYNEKREKKTPTWATVAKMYKISKWLEWIEFCAVERYTTNTYRKSSNKANIILESAVDLLDELLSIN